MGAVQVRGITMADIVERLLGAVGDETQSDGALLQEAADEITRLRDEYTKMRVKVDQYQKLAEPEF